MKNILEEILTNKVSELKKQKVPGQKILNMIKEDPLHLIVLNFLYSHKIYKNCVMYGGSALKIMYGLPRMSVDLDFQMNFPFLPEDFKKDIIDYFKDKYGYEKLGIHVGAEDKDTIVIKITFSGLDKFKIPDISFTTLKVRLDFNKFDTGNFQQILVPKKNEYYHFNLRTYPISTLMASKMAAVLNRVQYCVPNDKGRSLAANYKGRDIYDLIWYLQKGIIPNLRYLKQREHVYQNYPSLFKKMKERLANLGDGGRALRADLTHLYLKPEELDGWMNQWDKFFLEALQNYSAHKIERFAEVKVMQDFDTDNFIFEYFFKTDQNKKAVFRIVISDLYLEDFPLSGFKRDDIEIRMDSGIDRRNEKTAREYAGLFYLKIEDFLERVHHISPRLQIETKLIVYSHGDYDPNAIVSFTHKELESCQLEDLLS